jgi:hypothetical protein
MVAGSVTPATAPAGAAASNAAVSAPASSPAARIQEPSFVSAAQRRAPERCPGTSTAAFIAAEVTPRSAIAGVAALVKTQQTELSVPVPVTLQSALTKAMNTTPPAMETANGGSSPAVADAAPSRRDPEYSAPELPASRLGVAGADADVAAAAANCFATSAALTAPTTTAASVPPPVNAHMHSTPISGGVGPNPKGKLIEEFAKMNWILARAPRFTTTGVAPFVSTVTICCGESDIVLTGPDHTTKKAAEQAVATAALADERVRRILRLPPLSALVPSAGPQSSRSTTPFSSGQYAVREGGAPTPETGDGAAPPKLAPVPADAAESAGQSTAEPVATFQPAEAPASEPHAIVLPPATTPPVAPIFYAEMQAPFATTSELQSSVACSGAIAADGATTRLSVPPHAVDRDVAGEAVKMSLPVVAVSPAPHAVPPAGTSAAATVCELGTNPKGKLLEDFAKIGRTGLQAPQFITTTVAPFVTTVTIAGPQGDIVLTGPTCTTKKAAEREAAAVALVDARVRQLLRLPALSPPAVSTVPQRSVATTPLPSQQYARGETGAPATVVDALQQLAPVLSPPGPPSHREYGGAEPGTPPSSTVAPTDGSVAFPAAATAESVYRGAQPLHQAVSAPAVPPDYKGELLGACARRNNITECEPKFDTTTAPPYRSTFTLSGVGIEATGPSAQTRKAAEQAVAHMVLRDPTARQRLRLQPLGANGAQETELASDISSLTAADTVFAELDDAEPDVAAPAPAVSFELGASLPHSSGDEQCAILDLRAGATASTPTGVSEVTCSHCKHYLGDATRFFVYTASETEVHVAIKPEMVGQLLGSTVPALQNCSEDSSVSITSVAAPQLVLLPIQPREESPVSAPGSDAESETPTSNSTWHKAEKQRIMCGNCSHGVGVKMNTGPHNAPLCSVGVKKVLLNEAVVKNWKEARDAGGLSCFEQRDADTFYGATTLPNPKPTRQPNHYPVIFPTIAEGISAEDCRDFQVQDLLSSHCIASGKVPRAEQMRAYHLALKDNLIVMFPTGHGKTFVASLVMHRFRKLNPSKLVVMVVDRVPLVQQQSDAIHRDTGMTVCPISSENSTHTVLKYLLTGKYDALVVTAGVLRNWLVKERRLSISDFSAIIMDECHHVGGKHNYSDILAEVERVPHAIKPRVVGLSASPLKINSSVASSAAEKLSALREAFFGADVFRPPGLSSAFEGTDFRHVQLSERQVTEQQRLMALLPPLVAKLLILYKPHKPELRDLAMATPKLNASERTLRTYWATAANMASENHHLSLPLESTDPLARTATETRQLINELQSNFLLGPAFGHPSAKISSSDVDAAGSLPSTNDPVYPPEQLSNQVLELCRELDRCGATSKTLVFVPQRCTAESLYQYLHQRYPALYCAKLIGQGGWDGMQWRGLKGQGVVLDRFRRGETKLIVCTSVLEEGE